MKEHIMIKQQGFRAKLKSRQHGAVAIIVALSLVALVGMLALVIDLGHLYVTKAELQNAADAAALSGAKDLDGTMAGLSKAKAAACEVGGMNKFDLSSKPVANTKDDPPCSNLILSVGACPEDSCMKLIGNISSEDDAAGRLFMKADTGSRTMNTWFAPIWNVAQTKTFGMAVAGPEVLSVAPIGICAVDKDAVGDGINSYFGFDKGVAYDLAKINGLLVGLADGTPLWLHPTAQTQAQCKDDVSFASKSKFSSYLCLGKSGVGISKNVYANTGWEAPQDGAINTRFRASGEDKDSDYSNMSAKNCAPDKNVKEFLSPQVSGSECDPLYCTTYSNKTACGAEPLKLCKWDQKNAVCESDKAIPTECGTDVDWLNYTPTQQGATLSSPSGSVIVDTPATSVIASYIKPVDTTILNADYPATSPYQNGIDGTAKYYTSPYTSADVVPTKGRRLINVVIVNCSTGLKLNGVCEELPKLGVAQFFMPVKANFNASGINPKTFYLEFVRKIPTTEESMIKLYK
jgi:hypothetical protein